MPCLLMVQDFLDFLLGGKIFLLTIDVTSIDISPSVWSHVVSLIDPLMYLLSSFVLAL